MIHEFNLNNIPFIFIKNEQKDIEMRLYDERRQNIQVGDTIVFTNNTTKEKISVIVLSLHIYPTFKELYEKFSKERLGYLSTESADYRDMEQFYSKERIDKYGVVGIEIKLIK